MRAVALAQVCLDDFLVLGGERGVGHVANRPVPLESEAANKAVVPCMRLTAGTGMGTRALEPDLPAYVRLRGKDGRMIESPEIWESFLYVCCRERTILSRPALSENAQ